MRLRNKVFVFSALFDNGVLCGLGMQKLFPDMNIMLAYVLGNMISLILMFVFAVVAVEETHK